MTQQTPSAPGAAFTYAVDPLLNRRVAPANTAQQLSPADLYNAGTPRDGEFPENARTASAAAELVNARAVPASRGASAWI